jgi:hypothetical protein
MARFARALVASILFLAVNPLLADSDVAEKPKLTARPQGVNSGLALTALDEKRPSRCRRARLANA